MTFSSKKYTILLILICLVFVMFIVKAFDYLPDKSVEGNNIINSQRQNMNIPIYQDNNQQPQPQQSQQQEENRYNSERHKSGHIDFMPKERSTQNFRPEYEEIKAPKGTYEEDINVTSSNKTVSLSPDEQALRAIIKASKYKSDYDYTNALNELLKVPELTSDKELVALSYEKTAEVYAAQKMYGTALSFAGKAYNTSPNINREVLMARIYYHSGENENAISRMNAILSKGFID